LKGIEIEILYVAGCDPVMQKKMFKESFVAVGFDENKLRGVDVRNKTTEEVQKLISSLIENTRNGPK